MGLCQTYLSPGYQFVPPSQLGTHKVIIVFIDYLFEGLIPFYIKQTHRDIENIQASLEIDNFPFIETLAAQMKSKGSSYGFDFISFIGGQLELAALVNNRREIVSLLSELSIYLEQIQVVYVRR